MDLFGTGSVPPQLHDLNGGILENGLFWTVPLDRGDVHLSGNGRRARIEGKKVPVVDSFQAFSGKGIPAGVSFEVKFEAEGTTEKGYAQIGTERNGVFL